MSITFKSTIDDIKSQIKQNGCSLTKLDTEFHAQSLHDWLKEKLPKHLDVWIINAPHRSNEVNVYAINNPVTPGTISGGNPGTPKAIGMPAEFKKWRKQQFKLRN